MYLINLFISKEEDSRSFVCRIKFVFSEENLLIINNFSSMKKSIIKTVSRKFASLPAFALSPTLPLRITLIKRKKTKIASSIKWKRFLLILKTPIFKISSASSTMIECMPPPSILLTKNSNYSKSKVINLLSEFLFLMIFKIKRPSRVSWKIIYPTLNLMNEKNLFKYYLYHNFIKNFSFFHFFIYLITPFYNKFLYLYYLYLFNF